MEVNLEDGVDKKREFPGREGQQLRNQIVGKLQGHRSDGSGESKCVVEEPWGG